MTAAVMKTLAAGAYCCGFHLEDFNAGVSYVEKQEVRVLLRQVGFHVLNILELA